VPTRSRGARASHLSGEDERRPVERGSGELAHQANLDQIAMSEIITRMSHKYATTSEFFGHGRGVDLLGQGDCKNVRC
jgi:hypothetical protein